MGLVIGYWRNDLLQSVMSGTLPRKSLIPVGRDYVRGSAACLNGAYEWQSWSWTRLITAPKIQKSLPAVDVFNPFGGSTSLFLKRLWPWKTPQSLMLGRFKSYLLSRSARRISQNSENLIFQRTNAHLNACCGEALSIMESLADDEAADHLWWDEYQEESRLEGEVFYLEMISCGISFYGLLYNKANRDNFLNYKLDIMFRKKIELVEIFVSSILLVLVSSVSAMKAAIDWTNSRYKIAAFSCLGPYRRRIYPPLAPIAPPVLT